MLCTLNLPHSLKVEATSKCVISTKIAHGFVDFPNAPLLYKPSTTVLSRLPGKCPPPNLTVLCLRVTIDSIYLRNGLGNIEIVMHIRVSHANV